MFPRTTAVDGEAPSGARRGGRRNDDPGTFTEPALIGHTPAPAPGLRGRPPIRTFEFRMPAVRRRRPRPARTSLRRVGVRTRSDNSRRLEMASALLHHGTRERTARQERSSSRWFRSDLAPATLAGLARVAHEMRQPLYAATVAVTLINGDVRHGHGTVRRRRRKTVHCQKEHRRSGNRAVAYMGPKKGGAASGRQLGGSKWPSSKSSRRRVKDRT